MANQPKKWRSNDSRLCNTFHIVSAWLIKVHMTRNFLLAHSKELSKWWRMAFVLLWDTFGWWVIQDFGLCMTSDVTLWTQNNVTSQKMEYLRRLFLYRTENLYSCCNHDKFLAPRSWSVICSCCLFSGLSYYGHYTTQAQESPLDSGATNKAFFILGR